MFLNFKKNREDLSGPLTAKEVDQNRERFLLVLSDMTGHHVNVTLLVGTSFKAIFHTVIILKPIVGRYVTSARTIVGNRRCQQHALVGLSEQACVKSH